MKKIHYILIATFLLFSFSLRENSVLQIIKIINQYFTERPMEKVFLHLDKPFYVSGEDLWYAGYVTNFNSNTPSNLSEILHVEIFNKKGQVITKLKNQIYDGIAKGLIELPDTLSPDFYQVKAYTNWSRNFDEGLMYNKFIKIVSPNFDESDSNEIDRLLEFFPEGGEIIAGKLNNIAFNTNYKNSAKAYLFNSQGDTINKISYDGNGFGKFRLVPKPNDGALFLAFEGSDKRFTLPNVKQDGIVLRLAETSEYFNLYLENSKDLSGKKFSLIIMNKGNIVSAQDGIFRDSGVLLKIIKEETKGGLHHIVIIDEDLNVLNQRLFFNSKDESKDAITIRGNQNFKIGDIVNLELIQNNSNLSQVSVAIRPYMFFGDSIDMVTINDLNISLPKDLINDHLICESITSYKINQLIKEKPPTFNFPVEKRDLFQIKVQLDKVNNPTDFYSISMKTNDTIDFYFNENTEPNLYSFIVPAFNGKKDLIVKPYGWSESDKSYEFALDNTLPSKAFKKKFSQSAKELAYAKYAKENQTISRFYNIQNKNPLDGIKEELTFSILKFPDASITLKDYIVLPDMLTISKELLEGVRITKEEGKDRYKIQLRSVDEETGYFDKLFKEEPLRIIDGVPVYDSKYIVELDPIEVKKISMTYKKGALNGVHYEGVLAIETIEGIYGRLNKRGQGIFDIYGYADNYEFVINDNSSATPNFRSTYYWNPSILLSNNSPSTISFPTSNDPGKYIVDVRGINSEGDDIHQEFIFEVSANTN